MQIKPSSFINLQCLTKTNLKVKEVDQLQILDEHRRSSEDFSTKLILNVDPLRSASILDPFEVVICNLLES